MKKRFSRRDFIKITAVGAGAAVIPGCSNTITWEEFFQTNFKEMSPQEIKHLLAGLEEKYTKEYGVKFTVKATPAREGVVFGYALDLSRCIGCRRCVYACVKENNPSRDVQIQWIRVLRMKKGEFNLEESEHYYDPDKVPEDGYFYVPVQCQQCENPPCVKACPVKATWKDPDGITVIDYNWCIGCRFCMAACPYRARKFNWTKPLIPKDEMNTDTHYLGNRPRMKGVVEKCTFCVQRSRDGRYPACVEACPVGARKFGNLLDKESEIRYILENFRTFRLKEDLNTQPKFFYFFSLGWG
ncbi:MAG: 4Fe-4S dicluster domain-containing protein [Nitrospiraceae bacterium]|nr:MAG: 4Fe-4S dicluster domain-containing protein [Nitrospiraceae bacterium]